MTLLANPTVKGGITSEIILEVLYDSHLKSGDRFIAALKFLASSGAAYQRETTLF